MDSDTADGETDGVSSACPSCVLSAPLKPHACEQQMWWMAAAARTTGTKCVVPVL
jgi:hypothetical protein